MTAYFPLKVHSHFSLSVGLSMPKHIAKRCDDIGLEGAAMTDLDSISGAIDYMGAMGNKKKKPVIGCEISIVKSYQDKERVTSTILLIAKNYQGWLDLIKITSKAQTHYYFDKPHITLDELGSLLVPGNVVAIAGWLGSELADIIFKAPKDAYLCRTYDDAKALVNPDWTKDTRTLVARYKEIFGTENFYIGLQLIDAATLPASKLVADGMRYIAKVTQTTLVAVPDSYYAAQNDAYDQRVLLVNKLDTTLKDLHKKNVYGDNIALGKFFNGVSYHIPSFEEMMKYGHTEAELEATLAIAGQCEKYSLTAKPMLPQFPTPNNESAADYLRHICEVGWQRRMSQIENVVKQGKHTKEEYYQRFETEFAVLTGVGLADYFLIVDDFLTFARNDGQLTGAGRGSAAGSLILYLLGATHVDPIEYDLLFERFYNAGRNTVDNISLPDVDMDFEKNGRERIIHYARGKYGHDKVGQIITFNRMQGRGAVKDVARAHDALGIEEVNKITKLIPNDAEIADQLEALREADKQAGGEGDASIIEWALENHAEDFKEWVYYDDNEHLQGPLAKIFEQAIRMEGTKRASGKHAAGIVIAQKPLAEICPMVYDSKTGEMIAGMEMNALEKMGHVKFDFLGVSTLDKIHAAINHLKTGSLFI